MSEGYYSKTIKKAGESPYYFPELLFQHVQKEQYTPSIDSFRAASIVSISVHRRGYIVFAFAVPKESCVREDKTKKWGNPNSGEMLTCVSTRLREKKPQLILSSLGATPRVRREFPLAMLQRKLSTPEKRKEYSSDVRGGP